MLEKRKELRKEFFSVGLTNNKKGMFFTLLAIVLVSIFVVSYTIISNLSERRTIEKRVGTLNDFVELVEEDLERKMYISGFRIIFLLEKQIIESGNFIDNFNESFQEAFFNGSIGGTPQELMNGAKFSDIQQDLINKAAKVNANLNLSNAEIFVTQEDPWNVKVTLSADFFVEDKAELALWNKSLTVSAFVPIEKFGDPFYAVNTNSLVFNNFTRSPYTSFVSGSDVSNLLSHATNSYYAASTSAPSFLDRLQGINTANANGIESLVNLQELSSRGISVQQK